MTKLIKKDEKLETLKHKLHSLKAVRGSSEWKIFREFCEEVLRNTFRSFLNTTAKDDLIRIAAEGSTIYNMLYGTDMIAGNIEKFIEEQVKMLDVDHERAQAEANTQGLDATRNRMDTYRGNGGLVQ